MPSTLDLDTFRRNMTGKTIDVARAAKDQPPRRVDLSKVDLNRDGQITTKAEFDALFRQIDNADTNGDRRSVSLSGKNGEPNKVATLIEAVGDLAGVNILRELARDDIIIVGMNAESKHEAAALKRAGRNVIYIGDSKEDDKIDIGRHPVQPAGRRRAQEVRRASGPAHEAVGGDCRRDQVGRDRRRRRAGQHHLELGPRGEGEGHPRPAGHLGAQLRRRRIRAWQRKPEARRHRRARQGDAEGCRAGRRPAHLGLLFSRGAGPGTLAADLPERRDDLGLLRLGAGQPGRGGESPGPLERATRGAKDAIDRLIAAKTTKGESVAVWSRVHGYEDGKPLKSFASLKNRLLGYVQAFNAYTRVTRSWPTPRTASSASIKLFVDRGLQAPDNLLLVSRLSPDVVRPP